MIVKRLKGHLQVNILLEIDVLFHLCFPDRDGLVQEFVFGYEVSKLCLVDRNSEGQKFATQVT